MTISQIIQTIFELIFGIAIILGFIHKDKLIAWEDKHIRSRRNKNV